MGQKNYPIAPKKIQWAIKMLLWHTKLAEKNKRTVEIWLTKKHIDRTINLLDFINDAKQEDIVPVQITIFDFVGGENNEKTGID